MVVIPGSISSGFESVPQIQSQPEAQPKTSILETLKEVHPSENVCYAAVQNLKNPDDIKRFLGEYADSLKAAAEQNRLQIPDDPNTKGLEAFTNPATMTTGDISFALRTSESVRRSPEIAQQWMAAFKAMQSPESGPQEYI